MSEKNTLQEYCQKNKLDMPIYTSWSDGVHHQLEWWADVTININKDPKLMHQFNLTLTDKVKVSTIVAANSKTSAEKQAAMLMLDLIKSTKHHNLGKISNLSKLKAATKLSVTSTHNPLPEHDLTRSVTIDQPESDDDLICSDIDVKSIEKIYLIDLENKPLFHHKHRNDSIYIGFINSIHHSVDRYHSWHKCKSDDIENELFLSKNTKLLYLIDGGTADLVDHFMTALIYPMIEFIKTNNVVSTISIISGNHAGWCTRTCLEKILKWKQITNIDIYNAVSI